LLEIQLTPIDLRNIRQHVRTTPPVLAHQNRELAKQSTLTDTLKRTPSHDLIEQCTPRATTRSSDSTDFPAPKTAEPRPPAGARQHKLDSTHRRADTR